MIAEHGNKVIRISESEINKYLSLGYDIKNDDGTVLHRAVPSDITSLKSAFTNQLKMISELESHIVDLKDALAKKDIELQSALSEIADLKAKKPSTRGSKTTSAKVEA